VAEEQPRTTEDLLHLGFEDLVVVVDAAVDLTPFE